MIVVAIVLGWVLLSLGASAFTNPLTMYVNMTSKGGFWMTRFIPVPCLIGIAYMKEEYDEHWIWVGNKKRKQFRRVLETTLLFSLPARLRFLRVSRMCAASSAEHSRDRIEVMHLESHPHYRDVSAVGEHRCHETIGYLPPNNVLPTMLTVMGYDEIVNLYAGGIVSTRLTGDKGGTRALIDKCQSLDEAESVAGILQRIVDAEEEKRKTMKGNYVQIVDADQAMRKRVLGREHVSMVSTAFREKSREYPDVPAEVLVEFVAESMV